MIDASAAIAAAEQLVQNHADAQDRLSRFVAQRARIRQLKSDYHTPGQALAVVQQLILGLESEDLTPGTKETLALIWTLIHDTREWLKEPTPEIRHGGWGIR